MLLFSLNHWLQKIDMNLTFDSKMQKFNDYFVKTVDKYAPLTKKRLQTHQENTWISNNIKRQITKTDRLFQKWLKTGSEVDHDLYKKSCNMITDSIRKAKYAYYQNTISKTGAQGVFKLF